MANYMFQAKKLTTNYTIIQVPPPFFVNYKIISPYFLRILDILCIFAALNP